jgi:radical SAM superfamily enzyme YgiQ (UPF0313 family)
MKSSSKRKTLNQIISEKSTIDVLLIQPPVLQRKKKSEQDPIQFEYWASLKNVTNLLGDQPIEPNMGLLYIASLLKKEGFTVKLLDFNIIDRYFRETEGKLLSIEDIQNVLLKQQSKIVGISCMTNNYWWAEEIARVIKEESPDTLIVLGGMHCSFVPIELLNQRQVFDVIVRGEGEYTMLDIVMRFTENKEYNNIPGTTYIGNKGECFKNPSRPLIKDIDSLPFPSYELWPTDIPLIPRVYTARGCPSGCAFCVASRIFSNTVRYRNPKEVLKEILYIKNSFHPEYLVIGDLTFFASPQNSETLCKLLIDSKNQLKWWCQTRANLVTRKRVHLLKDAGCVQVAIGFESGSQEQLDKSRKNISLNDSIKACKFMKDAGISLQGYWIFGLPDENYDSALNTISFIKNLFEMNLMDSTHISVLVPYPGTDIYQNPEKYGITINNFDFSHYWMNCDELGAGLPVFDTKYLNKYELYSIWQLALAVTSKYYRNRARGNTGRIELYGDKNII